MQEPTRDLWLIWEVHNQACCGGDQFYVTTVYHPDTGKERVLERLKSKNGDFMASAYADHVQNGWLTRSESLLELPFRGDPGTGEGTSYFMQKITVDVPQLANYPVEDEAAAIARIEAEFGQAP